MTPSCPTYPTSFVGRAEELAAVPAALRPGRLLTLTGPGGAGKTRLAARVAADAAVRADRWRDGTAWVALEDVTDPADVAVEVCAALGAARTAGADPVTVAARTLRDRELLLVLDNAEHVADGVAAVAAAVAAGCPGVAVLATSRSPVGIAAERVLRVPPLGPDDAVALFLDRAGGPGEPGTRADVRRVCDHLDRLPLALELAAGWTGTLTTAQIADAMRDPQPLLDGGPRDAPFRLRSLAGSVGWSHDLLDDGERALFRALAVCEPGFDAAVVTALAGPAAVRALRGLVDASLVVADTSDPVTARYRMLATVRAYARGRLDEAGETVVVRDRHLAAYLDRVRAAAPLLATDKDAWRARVEPDHPNLRAAIEWGLARPDPGDGRRLAAATAWLWHLGHHVPEGLRLLRRAVDAGAGERTALQAECVAALLLVSDTTIVGEDRYEDTVAARELAGATGAAAAGRLIRSLGAVSLLARDPVAAAAEAEAARADALAAGDGFVADASASLAGLLHVAGDRHRAAIEVLTPATAGLLARGDRGVAATGLAWLAQATARAGDVPAGIAHAERAVAAAEPLQDLHRLGITRWALVENLLLAGRTDDARAALEPLAAAAATVDADVFVPGLYRCRTLLALATGATVVPEPESPFDAYDPATALLRAVGLRLAGDPAAGARLVELTTAREAAHLPDRTACAYEQAALLAEPDDLERALDLHHEALRLRAGHDLVLGRIDGLAQLARCLLARGAVEQAAVLAGAVDRARTETGYAGGLLVPAGPAVAGLDPDLVARGRELDLATAIAYATRARGPRRRPTAGWDGLTPTERSVAELAAEGLSNPEIAARLFVGRATVKTHLTHVYAKLAVANRTELARSYARTAS